MNDIAFQDNHTVMGLILHLQDLWKDWEKYKVALESSQAPELMLICDKWEQLKYVSRDYFSKYVDFKVFCRPHLKKYLKIKILKSSKYLHLNRKTLLIST